jgi:hypothetical protein
MPIVEALGLDFAVTRPREARGLSIVASGGDAGKLSSRAPYVYVEHGAGQTYGGHPHSGYPGSLQHRNVKAFICPNERVAGIWRAAYPDVPAVAVGCPFLDPWHLGERPIPVDRTVTITFHWKCKVSKFSNWAFPHYRAELHHVVDAWRRQGWIVLGHAHPKERVALKKFWDSIGVEFVEDIAEVYDRSHVLVADNSSVLPEFMSLGRPVIFMNAPWYDTNTYVGGRFWDWEVGGYVVGGPLEMPDIGLDWLCITDPFAAARKRVVESVYAYSDGHASARAAEVIHRVLKEMT